jgi:hypothetical protein
MLHKLDVYRHCIHLQYLCVGAIAFCAKATEFNQVNSVQPSPIYNPVSLQILTFIFWSDIIHSV